MMYQNIGVTNFCNFLTGVGGMEYMNYDFSSVSKVDLYKYVEAKTDNFNPIISKIFIEELRDCAYDLKFLMPYTPDGYDYNGLLYTIDSLGPFFPEIDPPLIFSNNKTLKDRVVEIIEVVPAAKFKRNLRKLFLLSEIAETEYQRTIAGIAENGYQRTTTEITYPVNLQVNKSKLTRRQKIALLESVGVMKYLDGVFSGNQTATASFLNRVINEDLQNIREDINKAPESLLKDPKIIKVIDPILMGLGLKNKD